MKKTYSEIEKSLESLVTQYKKINLLKFLSSDDQTKDKIKSLHQNSKKILTLCIEKWEDGIGFIFEDKGISQEEVKKICEQDQASIQDIYKIEYIIKEIYSLLHKKKISKKEIIFAKKTIEQGMKTAKDYGEINNRKNWRFI